MNSAILIAIVIAVLAVLGAGGSILAVQRRDQKRASREALVAKMAQEYLSRFEIRAKIVATTLGNGKIALMIETPPHKKLRFSYIIEQPIRQFIQKQTNIEVDRLFWRFPMADKKTKVPDVQYGIPTTVMLPPEQTMPAVKPVPTAAPAAAVVEEEDEYFQGQSYHIEEVSWNDFSTISKPDDSGKSS